MTAGNSLILLETGAHRAPLQLRRDERVTVSLVRRFVVRVCRCGRHRSRPGWPGSVCGQAWIRHRLHWRADGGSCIAARQAPFSPLCEIHHLRFPPDHISNELAITCSSTRHSSTSCSLEMLPRSSGLRNGQPYSLYQMTRHPVSSLAVDMSDSGNSSVFPVGLGRVVPEAFAHLPREPHTTLSRIPFATASYYNAERPPQPRRVFCAGGCNGLSSGPSWFATAT